MRWVVGVVFLVGCVRARATVVHLTDVERTSGARGGTIARTTAPAEIVDPPAATGSANLTSVELGALVPFQVAHESTRVHLAPGVRIFSGEKTSVLWGVAVGADYIGRRGGPGFALEGTIHAGGSSEPGVIQQALDLFGGVLLRSNRASTSVAVGPSFGVIGLPGGHSVITLGLGVRVTASKD